MTTRQEVYKSIDTEREYQTNLERNDVKDQSPMEHAALIRKVIRDIEDAWYNVAGQPPMDYMRKIAAIAVRSMEEHGAPPRTNQNIPIGQASCHETGIRITTDIMWECIEDMRSFNKTDEEIAEVFVESFKEDLLKLMKDKK